MTPEPQPLVCVHVAQGQMQAHLFKSLLESEGIPVLLRYESVGVVYGFTVDGLGEVGLFVPANRAAAARRVLADPVLLPDDTEPPTV
ncbi:MAG: DUF2007 domain-containing protein [Chloroflexi bacterium]|nr:DUF2007 domain-containing protein [Chloroflexota bacterium]MBU1749439.1 DUF2007 domain-containing protein [Chloroflexota bacterium]MBU1878671.1 DUF2007 domain-containing protein [Chloroflexota bacterium]